MTSRLCLVLVAAALLLQTPTFGAPVRPVTAFALMKEGNQSISPKLKDKVIEIRSEPSTNGLAPDVWYLMYYDPTAPFKKTEIKFVDGKKTGVTHPRRVFDSLTGTKQLDHRRLKIDSDRALTIALALPELKNLDLQAAQYWLQRSSIGPTWKLRFWMPQLDQPGQLNQIGDIYISSTNGEILKKDLHF